ncbi:hypothetical protein CEXT_237411 [Caerostris extrusa]|uniref:Uncharacterized protein n=1 Tax=Caerostris extrusa TaxID=172846 RepID=A0AAV4R3V3_CAEEX|nr:hypothetical protein CEXT_237411 [Caerostris extrusa]
MNLLSEGYNTIKVEKRKENLGFEVGLMLFNTTYRSTTCTVSASKKKVRQILKESLLFIDVVWPIGHHFTSIAFSKRKSSFAIISECFAGGGR